MRRIVPDKKNGTANQGMRIDVGGVGSRTISAPLDVAVLPSSSVGGALRS
jgi:hypothetical protein